MRLIIIRRFFILRLALSFVFDYWRIGRLKKRLQGKRLEDAVNQVCRNAGIRMRLTAFRLKGVLVKVGQFLSMREDILPFAFTKELVELQDALPAAPFSEIKPILNKELRGQLNKIFKFFGEKAIAAASLAQVHKAVLTDGTEVAVKIIRPGMEQLAQADLDGLGLAARLVQRIPAIRRRLDFVQMHQEFTETIHKELDCHQELQHLRRFANMFVEDPCIMVPNAYEEYTTRRILVMDYVEGARITDLSKLNKWGIDKIAIAEALLESYLRQLLVYGFVQVDPHPGNLLVLPDQRLCYLDFGMMDELTAGEIHSFRELMQSILLNDVNGITHALAQLGFLPADYNLSSNDPKFSQNLLRLFGTGEQLETTTEISGPRAIFQNSPIQLQAKYMFILRGVGFLKATLDVLTPNSHWTELLFRVGPSVFSTPVQADGNKD